MKKIAILLFCLFMPSAVFGANVVMSCGASKGEEYSFIDGWQETVVKGTIILLQEGDEFDLLVSTSFQKTQSYKEIGYTVVGLQDSEGFIRVGAFAPIITEIYNFSVEDKKVAWSSNRSGSFFPKTAVYLAECE